jgi:hypothetical protein
VITLAEPMTLLVTYQGISEFIIVYLVNTKRDESMRVKMLLVKVPKIIFLGRLNA